THAVIRVTSDDSLGPTEISYLENAFHSRALAAGRVRTLNSNDPSPGTVTEEKKADLEEFIAYATIAIGSLGYRIFEKADEVPYGCIRQRQTALENRIRCPAWPVGAARTGSAATEVSMSEHAFALKHEVTTVS
ncbi:hypothetical protein, partial [Brevibacterium paucivorans]